eukprot:1459049-Rhodomonas_salina.1
MLAVMLRRRYAMPGTDIRYAATRPASPSPSGGPHRSAANYADSAAVYGGTASVNRRVTVLPFMDAA